MLKNEILGVKLGSLRPLGWQCGRLEKCSKPKSMKICTHQPLTSVESVQALSAHTGTCCPVWGEDPA